MVRIVQELHERGWSYRRLARGLGLARDSVLRWRARLARGLPAVGRPGPAKRPLDAAAAAAFGAQAAALGHGPRRSRGAGALWRRWNEFVSRRDCARRVAEERRSVHREASALGGRLAWLRPCAVWAMDAAEQDGIAWNLVCDLASRFRFELLLARSLPAELVLRQLEALFGRYGPPLVLKRDNGGNLANPAVDRLLEEFGVVPLTSPPHHPRYNGAVEYAQREVKTVADVLVRQFGMPRPEALRETPGWLNVRPRPCLGGGFAAGVFEAARSWFLDTCTMDYRKEAKDWIRRQATTILDDLKECSRPTRDAAWRHATENWMIDAGLVAVVHPKGVSPH